MVRDSLKVGQTVRVNIGKSRTDEMYYIGRVKKVSSINSSSPVVALVKIDSIRGGAIQFDPILDRLLQQLNHDHPKGMPVIAGEIAPLSPIEELVLRTEGVDAA